MRLTDLIIGNAVTTIEHDSFSDCISLTDIEVPNRVTTIGDRAFQGCVLLKHITLSNSLTTMGLTCFANTAVESIIIPKSMTECLRVGGYTDGYLYEGQTYYLNEGPFWGCENLKNVTFEDGATEIAYGLFAGCVGLEQITIPDTVTIIEAYAFQGCLRLRDITIGNAITAIEPSAFEECISLTDIEIPNSVTTIGNSTFKNCVSLKHIALPNSLMTMGTECFDGCVALEGVILPNKRVNVMPYTFRNCTSLKTIHFPATVENIQSNAFYGCTSLESFSFAENSSLKKLEDYAFYGCTALKEVILPETTTSIGRSVFENCTNLQKVTIPESTKTIGNYIFKGCESLKEISIADYSIKSLPSYAFKDCPAIQKISLPKGLESIGAYAFMNDTALVEVVIPESVTTIDSTAFSYPDKTTIYGKTGSYAETFAINGGFTFVDSYVAAQGISLLDGIEYIVLDRGDTYRAIFEFFPEDATDVIVLTADNNHVTINGHDIYARYTGDTVITATATSGVTYEFTIHIRDARSISMAKQPTKLSYIMGEQLDLADMIVQVNYNDGSAREITDYVVSGFDSSAEGDCVVTVTWESVYGTTYSTTFTVNIVDPRPKLTGIYIDAMPTKREYERKESLDLTGLVVIATYTDDSEIVVTDYSVSGYNALKNGMQTITVTYGAFTATFTVAVGQKLVIMGDLSGDKEVTQEDADLISSYDAGLVELTAEQLNAGDLNSDGLVDAGDAIIICMYCAGLITTI